MLSKVFLFFLLVSQTLAAVSVEPPDVIGRVLNTNGETEYLGNQKKDKTPLGSLYKIYLYSYLVEEAFAETPYTCKGKDPEEIFCCSPGETINRNLALAKSCTPYFINSRLNISNQQWKNFWNKKTPNNWSWLKDIENLKPETVVFVDEILSSLMVIRNQFKSFSQIEKAMMGTVTVGTAKNAVRTWGSTLRVKTYTWRDANIKERTDNLGFTGGFAGWLPDGSAIWVSSLGHGRNSFQTELKLKELVDKHLDSVNSGCVEVNFFDRHPIASVTPAVGRPQGEVKLQFKSGKNISFISDGSIKINTSGKKISLTGNFSVNEYVGRVLDREVKTHPVNAARAFAIAARTFLYQNSKIENGCRKIADSTVLQRVSPAPATSESINIARWSDGLVLDRVPQIRYHSDKSFENRMSWVDAKSLAESGYSMTEILQTFYPQGLVTFGMAQDFKCEPNVQAERWLKQQSSKWRERLNSEIGFEKPDKIKVCQTPRGEQIHPVFAIADQDEIYVPQSHTRNDEVSIVHEYLHIGFKNHPRGTDEKFIENLAQVLQGEK